LCRRCLHCHAAANFIDTPPLPSSLHRRFCLLRRTAVAFIIAPLLIVAPPVVALLPLVVIMPPVEVVVHSVALLPHAAVVLRCCAARCRCVPPVAIVVPPILLPSSSRRRCLPCRANAPFIVAPPLPSLSRKRCLHCGAAAPFIVAPLLPSSSPTLIVAWFCLRRRAAAAFLVAPPLPSSPRPRFCLRHRAFCCPAAPCRRHSASPCGLSPSCVARRHCRVARPSRRAALSCRPSPSSCPVVVPPVALLPLAIVVPTVKVVVPPVALLPLAVVVPTVKVVVPPVALLPLAGVVPRRRAARCRCVPPVAVVVCPSKSLYCVVCTILFTILLAIG
jgi:hypothetical protein